MVLPTQSRFHLAARTERRAAAATRPSGLLLAASKRFPIDAACPDIPFVPCLSCSISRWLVCSMLPTHFRRGLEFDRLDMPLDAADVFRSYLLICRNLDGVAVNLDFDNADGLCLLSHDLISVWLAGYAVDPRLKAHCKPCQGLRMLAGFTPSDSWLG